MAVERAGRACQGGAGDREGHELVLGDVDAHGLSAAMRLSRTAMMARPSRLCMRFSTTATVMSTSTMPSGEGRDLVRCPPRPWAPLMRIDALRSCPERRIESVMEKCRPASSHADVEVVEQVLDDLAEGEGHDGEVVAAQAHDRDADAESR